MIPKKSKEYSLSIIINGWIALVNINTPNNLVIIEAWIILLKFIESTIHALNWIGIPHFIKLIIVLFELIISSSLEHKYDI